MNDKQLEQMIVFAEAGFERYALRGKKPKDNQDISASYADLAAMRQPITAEALLADGWVQRGWEWVLSRRYSMRYNADDLQWEFGIGRMAGGGKGNLIGLVVIASPSNMYDLRELVRLLGGAQ